MRRVILVGFLMGFVISGLCRSVSAASYAFTTIDAPFAGATSTHAQGINKADDIVGFYSTGGATHGFLDEDGEFTTIDFPGAIESFANGINDRGEIVGSYTDGSGSHGFVNFKKKFSSIDFPAAVSTSANGINKRGQIVGSYFDGVTDHGFLLSAGKFSTIDVPNAGLPTPANGIDDRGRIVGSCFSPLGFPAGTAGFLDDDSMFTFFQLTTAPATIFFTSANGINSGVIVGSFLQNFPVPNVSVGFVMPPPYDSPTVVQFESFNTTASGISSTGRIVGSYFQFFSSRVVSHGFLAIPQ